MSCATSRRARPSRSTIILSDMPEMAAAVYPILPRSVVTRVAGHYSSFDAGRGCPFQCSFCTIINVQGRKSRYRTPGRRRGDRAGERGAGHHAVFRHRRQFRPQPQLGADPRSADRAARARQIQHPAVAPGRHAVPPHSRTSSRNAARAGCTAIFLGLENINPESLMGAKKRQNKIWEYREMLLAWRAQKVMTYAGYILGFPTDTPEIDRARHRDHQERIADRHSRILLSDAAAGFRGSQEAVHARGADGPRHEQIRSRTRLHRPSADVERDLEHRSMPTRGRAITPTNMSRRSCAAPSSPASTGPRFWIR